MELTNVIRESILDKIQELEKQMDILEGAIEKERKRNGGEDNAVVNLMWFEVWQADQTIELLRKAIIENKLENW